MNSYIDVEISDDDEIKLPSNILVNYHIDNNYHIDRLDFRLHVELLDKTQDVGAMRWRASCKVLDIFTHGPTQKEAENNLCEASTMFINFLKKEDLLWNLLEERNAISNIYSQQSTTIQLKNNIYIEIKGESIHNISNITFNNLIKWKILKFILITKGFYIYNESNKHIIFYKEPCNNPLIFYKYKQDDEIDTDLVQYIIAIAEISENEYNKNKFVCEKLYNYINVINKIEKSYVRKKSILNYCKLLKLFFQNLIDCHDESILHVCEVPSFQGKLINSL